MRPVLKNFAGDIEPDQVKKLLYPPKDEKKKRAWPSPCLLRGEGWGEGSFPSDGGVTGSGRACPRTKVRGLDGADAECRSWTVDQCPDPIVLPI